MSLFPSPALLAPTWRILRIVLRVAGSLVLLAWTLILVAWLTLHWAILPRIDHWRPSIERAATRAVGQTVQIGAIRVESHGWVPTLEMLDVVVHDSAGREALRLARVRAAVSAASVLHLEPRFRQLLIDAPTLEARRDAQGRVFVAGIELRGEAGRASSPAADWFFSQEEFAIRNGVVRWLDEQREAPVLELRAVDFVLRNGSRIGSRRHDWRLDATPPEDWGARFSLRGRFTQPLLARPGEMQRWSGSGYADLARADVQKLRRYVDLPFELSEGDGGLRVWADVRDGALVGATADLALRAVNVRLAPDVEPLVLEQLRGRVRGDVDGDTYTVTASHLAFRTGEGLDWPAGDWRLRWRRPGEGSAGDGEFQAERLDLAILAQLAGRLPLGTALRDELAELRPQGQVQRLQARWQGPLDRPTGYRLQARVQGLHLAAQQRPGNAPERWVGRPGVAGADIEFTASDSGGEAALQLHDGALEFPGVFDEALIPLDRLEARLTWGVQREGRAVGDRGLMPNVQLQVRDARFANDDVEGTLTAGWQTGQEPGIGPNARLPGVLDLQGRLSRADATRTWRYLPSGIPAHVRDYVRRAVIEGTSRHVDFAVRGDLSHFPFADRKQGTFRIASQIENARFAYAPAADGASADWPAFAGVHGQLVFEGTSMQIRDARAQLFGFQLQQVQGGIADLAHAAELVLDGHGRGPLGDALRFVRETPVNGWTQRALEQASGSGDAQLKLGVRIPLDDVRRARVSGELGLLGNEVQVTPATPRMSQARGMVQFSDSGFSVKGASARVLGGGASFEGGTQKDGVLRFTGRGVASAEGLRQARELGVLPYLGEHLNGQAAYRIGLAVVHGYPELSITSDLVGLGTTLPAPLAKPAEAAWPLAIRTTVDGTSLAAGQPGRDRVAMLLGDVLELRYERELRDGAAQVVAGSIGVNRPAPEPVAGTAAAVRQSRLDLDAWRAVAQSFEGSGAAAGGDGGDAGGSGYVPSTIALQADELTVDQRRLTRVVAGLSQQAGLWRVNLDADQLNGYVEYRPPGGSRSSEGGRVYARLSRLSLPESAIQGIESLLDKEPQAVPALDIVVDDFQLRGMKLGRIEAEASNWRTAEIREWRLDKFRLTNADARLEATGHWRGVAGGSTARRAVMDFELDVADSGQLLERLSLGPVARAGKGRLQGQVSWLGSPLSLDFPTMDGSFNVDIHQGQFLKADPGIAKLAGVLSLQSLPRRLTLDFRDVFQEGFAFDAFTGDVKIERGVAYTNNLRLRGVTAAVLMEGRADIAHETQDLRVVVVPEINAGTASLAYAAINPAIGLGTFLAQWFLRKPLMEAGTREFHVTGRWDDPKIEQVPRKRAQSAVPEREPDAVVVVVGRHPPLAEGKTPR
ncbi:TIGR02099 family protein [Schlegelella sp. S2-27]|uniref:TIGR02099 family protein n=1 Tax=Caldimonas mangrovi TaxID=2944811 RepID=A0ABT0YKK0_9BURK|nr:YhdP family protein [Caldimonas mangrovi]MCM5679257.1 TIGR02099 family protein [Caldimonas mangrovi]